MGGEDRRIHARVQVTTEVRVSGPDGVQDGELRDLSKGGAGIYLAKPAGKVGDSVELFLPFSGGVEIAVMAEILRVIPTDRGHLHGLRFQLVEPAMREKLLELIEILLQSKGGESREHVRVSHRIPVRWGQLSDLKATIENISLGGLAMVVEDPLVLDEIVEITLPDTNGDELLLLRAKVLHQHPLEGGSPRYRVGLAFRNLTPVAKACLAQLLEAILDLQRASKK